MGSERSLQVSATPCGRMIDTDWHETHISVCDACKWAIIEGERDAYRTALEAIAAVERPTHEHYDDPDECPHCRSYVLLGLEKREEQGHD